MKTITLADYEIAKIIAEKYGVSLNNVVVISESKTEHYDSIHAKRVYKPVAYIYKEENNGRDTIND